MRKKTACSGWYEELFRSGSIDQNRSSIHWPLAKVLQRHGDVETGFKRHMFEVYGPRSGGRRYTIWRLGFSVRGLGFSMYIWSLGFMIWDLQVKV